MSVPSSPATVSSPSKISYLQPGQNQGIKSVAQIESELENVNELPTAQVAALGALLVVHHEYPRAIEILNNLLEHVIHGAKSGDSSFGDVFYNLGIANAALKFHEEATTYFASAAKSYLNSKDEQGFMLATVNQASALLILERDAEVVTLLSAFLKRFEAGGVIPKDLNRHHLILCYATLAGASRNLGLIHETIEFLRSGLCIAEGHEEQNDAVVLSVYQNLGAAYNEVGQFSKAIPFHQQGVALAKALHDSVAQAQLLVNLGFAQSQVKLYIQALECFQAALRIWISLGNHKEEVTTRERIATMHYCNGNVEDALYEYQLALNGAQQNGYSELWDVANEKIKGIWAIKAQEEETRAQNTRDQELKELFAREQRLKQAEKDEEEQERKLYLERLEHERSSAARYAEERARVDAERLAQPPPPKKQTSSTCAIL